MNVENYVKDKGLGFWFSVTVTLLSLVTAIVYAACYAGSDNINWTSFAFMIAAFVGGALLIGFNRYKWAPYLQAPLVFVSLLLFIYGIYYYVSVVMVGIDADHFDAAFIVNTVLYVLVFGLSVANLFLKQDKAHSEDMEVKNESKDEEAAV